MKDPYSIVKRPLITEKGMNIAPMGKYAFEVDINANKIEIAEAVHKIFSVDVTKVNTLRVKGKAKRVGRFPEGKTPDWKKAYVTLKPGQRIDIFEGA
ncbi:MAG: 50S ribosomal protein L23 [Armatimonadota bacterium]|jgi:large subunit ribosomal protein L23